jgi:hypothetical protein
MRDPPELPAADGGRPPLLKHLGGWTLGVAIAFAVGGVGVYLMKQVGKSLDRQFVEQAAPGNPAKAIEQVGGDDVLLQSVNRTCTNRSAEATLTQAQLRATGSVMSLYSGEAELARAGAYVACLTAERPERLCRPPQRQHLAEATRQYFKLYRQMQEEWEIQFGGPLGGPMAIIRHAAVGAKQRAILNLPSTRVDPEFLANLRKLAGNGYVTARDFGGFAGFGAPLSIVEALKDVEVKKASCG